MNIYQVSKGSGRRVKEDGSIVNLADKLDKALQDEKYKDLGLVINVTNMAAGATIYGDWIDNLQWVRNIRFLCASDQQSAIYGITRDTSLTSDWGFMFHSSLPATGASYIAASTIPTNSAIGASGTLGYSAKFGIKNTSASANTFARLRIQLMGL